MPDYLLVTGKLAAESLWLAGRGRESPPCFEGMRTAALTRG